MSDQDRIHKVLKALRDGTANVRKNPSEENYRRAFAELEKAGNKKNGTGWAVGLTISGVVGLFLIAVLSQPSRYANQTRSVQTYSSSVPLNYCGDTSAGGTNTWYPVYVAYSEYNLRIIRKSLCCDAFYNSSVGMIQVASFYNRSRAYQMVAALKARNFTSASVGNGKVVTASPSSRRNTCR